MAFDPAAWLKKTEEMGFRIRLLEADDPTKHLISVTYFMGASPPDADAHFDQFNADREANMKALAAHLRAIGKVTRPDPDK